jgi:hypothetical protein
MMVALLLEFIPPNTVNAATPPTIAGADTAPIVEPNAEVLPAFSSAKVLLAKHKVTEAAIRIFFIVISLNKFFVKLV